MLGSMLHVLMYGITRNYYKVAPRSEITQQIDNAKKSPSKQKKMKKISKLKKKMNNKQKNQKTPVWRI